MQNNPFMQTGLTDLPNMNQSNMKKWDNFGDFWPIKLKFGVQVPFTRPHVPVTFGNDPTIFSPTNPTYQPKVKKWDNFANLWPIKL